MKNNILRDSIGGALSWMHDLKEDSGARRNAPANRSYLMQSLRKACGEAGFEVDVVRQSAIFPAMQVAVEMSQPEHSALIEYGGEDWSNIVFGVIAKLEKCDEATVFVQLEAREARAYICCTQARLSADALANAHRLRLVTLVDVVDPYNLADAYQAARNRQR